MSDYQLIILTGPSGAGKSSLANKLLRRDNINRCVTCTTRMPRENEEEGIDYFFLTGVEFSESMENNKFVEYSFHYGNWYGVRLSDIENSLRESHTLITLNWRGASALERKIQNSHVIYIEPPSVEILEKRLQDRGCYDRINYACEDMAQAKLFSHRVINDDLDEAYSSLLAIAENIV